MLSAADREQIARLGMSLEDVEAQLELFAQPPAPTRLLRPCRIGDGIERIEEAEHAELLARWRRAADEGRLAKLVPASGAASRMFQPLAPLLEGGELSGGAATFARRLRELACFPELEAALARDGHVLPALLDAESAALAARYLVTPAGLGYADRPKALILFHRYPEGARAALDEHLVEAAGCVADAGGGCRLHFTISEAHRAGFAERVARVREPLERALGARFELSFSGQDRSTDTIAVDLENRPFRLADGSLLFRPGGHGALLKNLAELGGDIVLIKNIDNVVPDAGKPDTLLWKRLLVGYLLRLEERGREPRPLRVCGVVRNQGEPGGGPFWVAGEGGPSLQIVESAEVDLGVPEQRAIWTSSTHFNPVDLVCSLRDEAGRPHDLRRFVDPARVFLAKKSHGGRELKALERPGLWNGAMAHWRTVFVEVPATTFAPVKTVLDLLREEHLS